VLISFQDYVYRLYYSASMMRSRDGTSGAQTGTGFMPPLLHGAPSTFVAVDHLPELEDHPNPGPLRTPWD